MTIRPAVRDDAPELARLVREAFRDVAERFHLTEENFSGQSPFCTPEMIHKDIDDGQIYHVLEQDGAMCGCIATGTKIPGVLYVRRLAVLPRLRGGGLGRELITHVIAEARRLGRPRIEFGAITDNVELISWYQRLGFAVKDKRRYDHLPFEVTHMFLELPSLIQRLRRG